MSDVLCVICNRPAGLNEHPDASVSHMACAMEKCYGSRGEDPSKSLYAEEYKRACETRTKQAATQ